MSAHSEVNSVNNKKFRGNAYSEVHSVDYTFEIDEIPTLIEFSKISTENKIINSTEFSTGAKTDNNDSWYLQLTIKGDSKTLAEDFSPSVISIFLFRKTEQRPIWIKYKLFFLNNENKKLQEISDDFNKSPDWTTEILKNKKCSNGLSVLTRELLINKSKLLENNTLRVGVELVIYDNYKLVDNPITPLVGSKRKLLSEDFKDLLLDNKKLKKDVTIKVGDKTLEAHKFMLITRSSVFEGMFSHNLEETKNNEVDIPDVDPEVFEKVIEFIYTDKIEDLNGCAEKLLEAADKYDLKGLKEMCQDFIAENISNESAVRVMILGYLHSAKRLMELAINHVVSNSATFKNSQEFKALKESYFSLYVEVLEKNFNTEKTNVMPNNQKTVLFGFGTSFGR